MIEVIAIISSIIGAITIERVFGISKFVVRFSSSKQEIKNGISLSNSSGNVINIHGYSGVTEPVVDPITSTVRGVDVLSIEKPYEVGLSLVNITNEQVEDCENFVSNFYRRKEEKKTTQITRNPFTMFRGAIFALGTESLENLEMCVGSPILTTDDAINHLNK